MAYVHTRSIIAVKVQSIELEVNFGIFKMHNCFKFIEFKGKLNTSLKDSRVYKDNNVCGFI